MEQTPSSPGHSPELPSVSPPSGGENLNGDRSREVANDSLPERQESRGEAAPVDSQAPTIPIPTPLPIAPTADPSTVADDTTQLTTSLPSVANDDDLIEKEWVDKAKKVLAETKDDPYLREEEVSRLQADYLLKRYGRELGSSQ